MDAWVSLQLVVLSVVTRSMQSLHEAGRMCRQDPPQPDEERTMIT